MRILHICVTGPYTDGFNYQENMLTKYQIKAGHDVHIITSEWQWGKKGKIEKFKGNPDYENDYGVQVHRLKIKGINNLFYRFKRFEYFYDKIEEINPDIIFVHNLQFLDVDKIVKYATKYKVKIYVDNHADFSNSARSNAAILFYKIFWRYLAHKVDPYTTKFYGVLPARVDFLKNIYKVPTSKCELLVMGADDEEVRRSESEENKKKVRNILGIPYSDFLIVTGGKIDEWKTQTLLLMEAVHNLNKDNVKLLIFGPISDAIREKFDQLYDKKFMRYINWADTSDAYDYFAIADLVVFPGRHSVYWEQVAGQGKPMICKYWEGTTHIDMGGNVEFLKTDSEEEIEQKLKCLIDRSSKYKKMVMVANRKTKEVFSYASIAANSIK